MEKTTQYCVRYYMNQEFDPSIPGSHHVLLLLYSYFRDCMRGHIESSENPEVKCPYIDDDYHCDEVMQEREIREVSCVED